MSAPNDPAAAQPRPFYLDDPDALRAKLARAEAGGTRMGRVWSALRRRARSAPDAFPWFTPFVALVTREPADIEAARQTIRRYLSSLESQTLGMGLHFHFWCYAFPHARWALQFQWLDALGAWDPAERTALRDAFLEHQFAYFFTGLRSKPEPECVDNQTMALAYSNALIGELFGRDPGASPLAARLRAEGLRRLPDMLGGFPPGGYSGEGSTYMDHVVGPCVPFLVELLERALGGEWFERALPPNGGSGAAIARMIAREWTPAGLTLPWDHYGYGLPVRACLAYAARRTGDPLYFELLEHRACWSHDVQVGWGYDDQVWSLVWWPEREPADTVRVFRPWAAPEVGAVLAAPDGSRYLAQIWDETNPGYPTRAHVNPNALTIVDEGVPLTVDGVPARGCPVFEYPDTWKEIANASFQVQRSNFGAGCAGAHSVLIVDGCESMRAHGAGPQAEPVAFDADGGEVCADVTALYRQTFPDARRVRRRSRLLAERLWLVEDLAVFDAPHDVTARWYFRPHAITAARGVAIETAEGVRLDWMPLLGPDGATVTAIDGYPDRLDGRCVRADFTQRGRVCRWLWLGCSRATRRVQEDVSDGWQVLGDAAGRDELDAVRHELASSALRLPFTEPAFTLTDAPVVRRWWYRRRVRLPAAAPAWLRLPRGLLKPALWVDGTPVDLGGHHPLLALLAPHVRFPDGLSGRDVEVAVRTDCGVSQYGREDAGGSGFDGSVALLVPARADGVEAAGWQDGVVRVRIGGRDLAVNHALMEEPA